MFEKIVTALEPFGLTIIVLSGLVLAGRVKVLDQKTIGYVTIVVGVLLIVVHVTRQFHADNKKK